MVCSGKGGVGKTTVAVNIACTLSNMGFKVGLLDADIYGPSIPKMFGCQAAQAIVEDGMIVPQYRCGVILMSIGFLIKEDEPVIWRGPMTTKMLYQLLNMTKWDIAVQSQKKKLEGKLDFLIIDTPPGTGDVHLSLMENYNIDGAIIVSTPQEVSLMDAHKGVMMIKKFQIPLLGVVENMSYLERDGEKIYLFGKEGVRRYCMNNGLEVLAEIPIEPQVSASGDLGAPLSFSDVSHNISNVFNGLMHKILRSAC